MKAKPTTKPLPPLKVSRTRISDTLTLETLSNGDATLLRRGPDRAWYPLTIDAWTLRTLLAALGAHHAKHPPTDRRKPR